MVSLAHRPVKISPLLSKCAALEGFSEALAAELDPEWNIKVREIDGVVDPLLSIPGYHLRAGRVPHERAQ